MSIESTLDRIAAALEKIAAAQAGALGELQKEQTAPATIPNQAPPGSPVPPAIAPAAAGATPPGAPSIPPQVAPGAPQATPSQAPASGAPMPGAAAPAPGHTPVQGVPTLDDIRAAFNDFARANQDKVQDAYAIVVKHGAKGLDDLQPATYPTVMQELKALGG